MRYRALAVLAILAAAAVFVARSDGTSPTSAQVLTASVTLSSAQIRDLHNTPVAVVPAQGAGKAIVPLWSVAFYTAGQVPYQVNDALAYAYEGSSLYQMYVFIEMLGETTNQENYETSNTGQPVAQTVGLNKALVVTCPTVSPANGDGTLKIVTAYTVLGP